MPSTKKTLHFLSCALVTAVAVGLMGFSLSTWWSKTTMECNRSEVANVSGSAEVTFGIFTGSLVRENCPAFDGTDDFGVVFELTKTGGAPVVLHGLVTGFCVLCLVCSAVTLLVALYNSVSNPYETYMGPISIYISSSIGTLLSVVILAMFVANVLSSQMAEEVVKANTDEAVDLTNKSTVMQVGYYLVIPYAVLSLIGIALIYTYDHAAYTHRKQQQKPTEDAPKEIMMY